MLPMKQEMGGDGRKKYKKRWGGRGREGRIGEGRKF